MTIKFSVIPSAALFDDRLSSQQLRTLACIYLFPIFSYSELAGMIGISRRQIIQHIRNLCSCGYVEKTRNKRDNGGHTCNSYIVKVDTRL